MIRHTTRPKQKITKKKLTSWEKHKLCKQKRKLKRDLKSLDRFKRK